MLDVGAADFGTATATGAAWTTGLAALAVVVTALLEDLVNNLWEWIIFRNILAAVNDVTWIFNNEEMHGS